MVSMKIQRKELASVPSSPEDSEYGYGTAINLEQEQIEALGLKNLKPGTQVAIHAMAVVKSVGMNESLDSKSGHMCIQITDMEASSEGKSAAAALYGDV